MSRACNHLGMRNLITYHLSATFECKIVISSAYWGKIKRGCLGFKIALSAGAINSTHRPLYKKENFKTSPTKCLTEKETANPQPNTHRGLPHSP